MLKFLFIVVCILVIGLSITYIYLEKRTADILTSGNQVTFLTGTVPNPLPDGDYHGIVSSYTGDWKGKSFDRLHATGTNIFMHEGQESRQFTFTTSIGPGLQDNTINVLKIEYDQPDNPWWLRFVLDEIVQTGPDQYLGKVHIRIVPDHPFTVGWFELKKTNGGE